MKLAPAVLFALLSPLRAQTPQANAGSTLLEIVDVDLSRRAPARNQPVCVADAASADGRKFVARLWKRYAPVFGLKDWRSFGPDSGYRRITLAWEDKKIVLESWHPIVERGGKGVAMSYGVTALDGRTRAEMLKGDDPQYLKRREAFDAITRECAARVKAR